MNRWLTALLLLTLAAPALAQFVYRWTDHEGRVHYGHAVPPEYRSLGYQRLTWDGRLLESVPPEMTPEERAAERRRRALQAELEAEQETQAMRDRLLLAAYASERDMIVVRDQRLEAMNRQRQALETSHRLALQRFEDLVARAAELDRNSQPVPPSLQESIGESQDELRRLRAAMSDLDGRMSDIRESFERDLERYRALTQSPN